jgi:AraC-like DNA-binding protein
MISGETINRPEQIRHTYAELIDAHLHDLVNGDAGEMFEIEHFAALMFIHPTHLSNTIKAVTGVSACEIYQVKIMEVALKLLADESRSIRQIALLLTYEPSQFTKWFKKLHGTTPKQYRAGLHPAV